MGNYERSYRWSSALPSPLFLRLLFLVLTARVWPGALLRRAGRLVASELDPRRPVSAPARAALAAAAHAAAASLSKRGLGILPGRRPASAPAAAATAATAATSPSAARAATDTASPLFGPYPAPRGSAASRARGMARVRRVLVGRHLANAAASPRLAATALALPLGLAALALRVAASAALGALLRAATWPARALGSLWRQPGNPPALASASSEPPAP